MAAQRRGGGLLWAALLSGLALNVLDLRRPAFLAVETHQKPVQSRRSFAWAVGAGLLSEPAWAEEEAAPKKKKERPPETLIAEGLESKAIPLNGRWSIVFGKKIAGKPVYKKDGESYFLMTNDCGQLQIDTEKKATCDGSIGIQKESGWVIDGKAAPNFKVRPETKEDANKSQGISASKLNEIVNEDLAKFERQSSVSTFRGTMDDDDEAVGDRLLQKMGAKIMPGM